MHISEIKLGERFRKDLGDIKNLADSIAEIGLLHPIVVDESNNLVCGERRLESLKLLEINELKENEHYRIVNIKDIFRAECIENGVRKDFLPSENVAIWDAMEKYSGGAGGSKPSESDGLNERRKRASNFLGVSTDTLSKAKQVIDYGNTELIGEMDKTNNVNKTYNKLQKEKQRNEKAKLGENLEITDDMIDFRFGDFREILSDIPDNSIDLILTDPPYPYEYIGLWSDLSAFAARVLKPNGFCITYSAHIHLPEVMNRLGKNLSYYWTFALLLQDAGKLIAPRNIVAKWKPILIYQKDFKKINTQLIDIIQGTGRSKKDHDWEQSAEELEYIIENFSMPNDVILDPMAGSGTVLYYAKKLKRRSIGAEIDKQSYDIAKKRIWGDA